MRLLGFIVFMLWTVLSAVVGYSIRSPDKVSSPIVVENVCPELPSLPIAQVCDIEPPIVIKIEEVKTVEPDPKETKPVIVSKENVKAEILFGYQSTSSGGSAEAILKMPVSGKVGAYMGYTTRNDFSVGVSYQF